MNAIGQVLGSGIARASNSNSDYGACEPQREAEIPHFLGAADKNLEQCLAAMNMLDERLTSVSRTDPPSPQIEKAARPIAVPQSGLGQRLQDLAERIDMLGSRIAGATRRLEV